MQGIAKLLVLLSALAFVIAIVGSLTGNIVGIGSEAYSRACTNLALLAIAHVVVFKDRQSAA
mgnify:CR=1 FL=1|jgi:hypothetical protein